MFRFNTLPQSKVTTLCQKFKQMIYLKLRFSRWKDLYRFDTVTDSVLDSLPYV